MEIYLIRHTETILNQGICYGQADVSIRSPFKTEFVRIASQIPDENCMIYSSPLQRCAMLANYIHRKNYLVQPILFDDRLKELNFGQWELKKWDQIEVDSFNLWMSDFVNNNVPGGESFQQLNLRVTDFLNSVFLTEHPRDPVAIVSHAGVIRSILCFANHIPLKEAFELKIPYGFVCKITL